LLLYLIKKEEVDIYEVNLTKLATQFIAHIDLMLISERGGVRFAELFESAASRAEVIRTFLALLELIQLKQLVCFQPEAFAEIEIQRAQNAAPIALTKDLDSDSTKPSIEETKT
jgi:chromatin segregation and condensation protein Rec8/ScpA/Scc1 (kleisin family)